MPKTDNLIPFPLNKLHRQFILLFLCFLEFSAAAILILRIAPDPKNAVLFGYSLSRLVLFSLAIVPAGWLLALIGLADYRVRWLQRVESILQKRPLYCGLFLFSLTLLGMVIWLLPIEMLGKYGLIFERGRPLLLVLSFFPAQFSLNWHIRLTRITELPLWRPTLVFLGILLAVSGLILSTGLGITPEQYQHWDAAGIPLTSLQLCVLFLCGVLLFGLLELIKPCLFTRYAGILDGLIILALFVGAILLWMSTPFSDSYSYQSTRPAAPYFQAYPASDAIRYDSVALSVSKGFGLEAFTDKPLYIVFLALLHVFAGYDYNLLAWMQTVFLALMVPLLYLFGRSFHGRLFGLLLAGIVLLRLQNGILLSNVLIYNITPRQFMTEVPTMLGIIVSASALFFWMTSSGKCNWWAFVTGAALGAVSLIRLNPFLLILATPIFLFIALFRSKKVWLIQCVFFFLGWALLVGPWLVTGRDQAGTMYYFGKLQFLNIGNRHGFVPPIGNEMVFDRFHNYNLRPVYAGLALPDIDIQTMPGYVMNHGLHNFVGSFLTLPDSLRPDDQLLSVLMKRPYWSEGRDLVAPMQIPFLIINLGLVACGLGWSWKRWRWAGLGPLFVFSVYSLANGFARTSGSRFIVPIDWVAGFYFALGLVCTFQIFPKAFRQLLQAEPEDVVVEQNVVRKASNWPYVMGCVVIVCVASLIPAAQTLIPSSKELCSPVDSTVLQAALPTGQASATFITGEVLYPTVIDKNLSFALLSCRRVLSFSIDDFSARPAVGQRIIMGIVSDSDPRPLLLAIPGKQGQPPQVLWRAGQ